MLLQVCAPYAYATADQTFQRRRCLFPAVHPVKDFFEEQIQLALIQLVDFQQ
ncbi:MAG: hypothetical protein NW241_11130 [Bacteroidia bacterium]|nr:hypothetical protein [Bacteroidia bacterium]